MIFLRIRRQSGAAALEGLVSLAFLLLFLFMMWSVARVVYDQSRLQTATQFAAAAGLQDYLRNSPGACDNANNAPCTKATLKSIDTSANVLAVNACSTRLGDPNQQARDCLQSLGLDKPWSPFGNTGYGARIRIDCSASESAAAANDWQACNALPDQETAEKVRTIRFQLKTRLETDWFLGQLLGAGISSSTQSQTLEAETTLYSHREKLAVD